MMSDRLPPPLPKGAEQSEQAVIGSLLIDPEIAPQLFATLKPDDFLFPENREIFSRARNLYRNGTPLDPITVRNSLADKERDYLSADGGLTGYLAQLMTITPTSANWGEYAKILREQSALYKIRTAAQSFADAVALDDCRPIVEQIQSLLDGRRVHRPRTAKDSANSFLDRQELPPPAYLGYGIPELDRMMFTEPGDVIVIGGDPSSGKTALALSVAWHIGKTRKTAFFSLETKEDKLDDRMMTRNAGVSFQRIKSRNLTKDDWNRVAETVAHDYNDSHFDYFTQSDGPLTLWDIENLTRAYGYDAIFIDYVQNLQNGYRRGYANIRERLTEISMELHSFAQSSGVTVFELAQLSRASKTDGWREPDMFDLKETGQFEQDADAVILLYRPKKGHKTLDEKKNRFLKVAKNKEGITGTLILDFDGDTQSFRVAKNTSDVMRELSGAGRAAKQSYRAKDPYQMQLDAAGPLDDLPF